MREKRTEYVGLYLETEIPSRRKYLNEVWDENKEIQKFMYSLYHYSNVLIYTKFLPEPPQKIVDLPNWRPAWSAARGAETIAEAAPGVHRRLAATNELGRPGVEGDTREAN